MRALGTRGLTAPPCRAPPATLPPPRPQLCDASGNSECNVTAALDGPTCPPWNDPGDPLSVNSSTNTGAIVGGVIGGVAGGMVIVAGVIWGLRWNRRRKQRMSPFIAEAEGQLPPSKDDLSNYNQVGGRGGREAPSVDMQRGRAQPAGVNSSGLTSTRACLTSCPGAGGAGGRRRPRPGRQA